MPRRRPLVLVLVPVLVLPACGPSDVPPPATPATATAAKPGPPHWTWEGAEGPAAWGTIDPSFAACSAGHEQSPIDLVATEGKAAPKLGFAYAPLPLAVSNNGHLLLADAAGSGAKITIDGAPYELVQLHAHTPSEHTIGGARADLEVHFVHKNARGDLAVVGLLARRGAGSAALAPFFDALAKAPVTGAPPRRIEGASLDLAGAIGERHAYFAYDGSLTTPPCSEHVRWFVLEAPAEVSPAQIDAARAAAHGDTARPVQPGSGRAVAHGS